MKKISLLIAVMLLPLQFALAQRTVSGVVTDAGTGEPLIGANVGVKGTVTGTTTNLEGDFTLRVPDDATALIVSYIGYTRQEVSIVGVDRLQVALERGVALDEIVVTALGVEERRSSLTYATQRLVPEDFNVTRTGDMARQLAGRVAGLSIVSNSGSAVSSSRIVLRGEASLNINKNQPLIVVDGVVVSNNLDGAEIASKRLWG